MNLAKAFLAAMVVAYACFGQSTVELPETPGLYAVIDTSVGRMIALLYDDLAPLTVKNFVELAQGTKATRDRKGNIVTRPFFDGLTFHRVIKGFMIQTGDVKGTGSSDCGVPTIPDEISKKLSFDNPGSLGMANTGKPNTGACQFFITVGRATHLDGRHAIFGQVLVGQEVAVAISGVPIGPDDRPKSPVTIKSITIQTRH